MKRLNNFFVLFCVSFGILNVSSRNIDPATSNCENELWELKQQYNSCGPENFEMLQIIDYIMEYRNKAINGTEFSRTVTNYCTTLKSAVSCSLGKATNISEACRDQVKIQFLLNLMRVINRVADDLCTEEIILEIASDKGFSCLTARGLANCINSKLASVETGAALRNKNVCRTTQYLVTCTDELFDVCQNDGIVKNYAHQIFSGLGQDFSCQ